MSQPATRVITVGTPSPFEVGQICCVRYGHGTSDAAGTLFLVVTLIRVDEYTSLLTVRGLTRWERVAAMFRTRWAWLRHAVGTRWRAWGA